MADQLRRRTFWQAGMSHCKPAIIPPMKISAINPTARSTITEITARIRCVRLFRSVVRLEQIAAGRAGHEAVVEAADHVQHKRPADADVNVQRLEQLMPAIAGEDERDRQDEDRQPQQQRPGIVHHALQPNLISRMRNLQLVSADIVRRKPKPHWPSANRPRAAASRERCDSDRRPNPAQQLHLLSRTAQQASHRLLIRLVDDILSRDIETLPWMDRSPERWPSFPEPMSPATPAPGRLVVWFRMTHA